MRTSHTRMIAAATAVAPLLGTGHGTPVRGIRADHAEDNRI
jgi:hypothetical protein